MITRKKYLSSWWRLRTRVRLYFDNSRGKIFYYFSTIKKRLALSYHYNGSNSSLFVNTTKIYQFIAKDFETKLYPLFLINISKDFTANNMKKQDKMDMYTIFLLIIILSIPVISLVFINIWWKKHDIK